MNFIYQTITGIRDWFELQAFGVCEWWGNKLGMRTANIRLFFIYVSFIAIGSPVVIYLIMAFILNLRNMVRKKRSSIWDL